MARRCLSEQGNKVYDYHLKRWSTPNNNATLGQKQYSRAFLDGMKSALDGNMEFVGRERWQKTDIQKTGFQRGFDFVNKGKGGE